MSRGWESKDVESQQEEAASKRAAARQTPLSAEQVRLQAERNSLELSRTRVLKDLAAATHPRRREQLEAALKHLDRKLAELK
jgi:galactokinase